MSNNLLSFIPVIGFILFSLGGMHFVIGYNQSITPLLVLSGIVCALGLFLFVYGNMILEEKESK